MLKSIKDFQDSSWLWATKMVVFICIMSMKLYVWRELLNGMISLGWFNNSKKTNMLFLRVIKELNANAMTQQQQQAQAIVDAAAGT